MTEEPWAKFFTKRFDDYTGFVETIEDAIKVKREFEISTVSSFVTYASTKDFGKRSKLICY